METRGEARAEAASPQMAVPTLVEQAMEAMSHCRDEPTRFQEERIAKTRQGDGATRYLNYVTICRLPLDEKGAASSSARRNRGGLQVSSSREGVTQVQHAISRESLLG